MRMLLKVQVPVDRGNAAIADGTLPQVIESAMRDLSPEAAYFAADEGMRAMFMVFDLADASQIPMVAERFFTGFGASVTMTPVMTIDDLRTGLEALAGAVAAGNGAH